MSQFTFSLNLPPVFSPENFYLSACNEEAYRSVTSWPNWPAHALLLYGEKGAGKSHLGHIWASAAGATVIRAEAFTEFVIPEKPVLLEDVEMLANEQALFHLFNASKENNLTLLMTSLFPAPQLPFSLPDLTSRLLSIPAVPIASPDDAMLAAALRKQFSDRQLKVDEEVIAYIVSRMERSFAHARALVETLDAEALSQQRSLTIPFVKRFL